MNDWVRSAAAVRPPLGGGALQFSPFNIYNKLDSAQPNTVLKGTGTLIQTTGSNQPGNVSAGVFKLKKPFRGKDRSLIQVPLTSYAGYGTVTIDWFAYTPASPGVADAEIYLVVEVYAVTADYDEDALTWNTASGLSLQSLGSILLSYTRIDNFSKSAAYTGTTTYRVWLSSHASYAEKMASQFDTSGLTIYGLRLRPNLIKANGAVGLSWASLTGDVTLSLPPSTSPFTGWMIEVPSAA